MLDDKYNALYASKERDYILNNLLHDSFELLKRNSIQYPNQDKWYYSQSVPRIFTKEGEQIGRLDGDKLIAMAIIKNSDEKKICAIRVDERFQNIGLGTLLFEDCFRILDTDKPLITISESNIKTFDKIINRYGWDLSEIIQPIDGKFNEPEYVFNKESNIRTYKK